jgi:hypothetical protein
VKYPERSFIVPLLEGDGRFTRFLADWRKGDCTFEELLMAVVKTLEMEDLHVDRLTPTTCSDFARSLLGGHV